MNQMPKLLRAPKRNGGGERRRATTCLLLQMSDTTQLHYTPILAHPYSTYFITDIVKYTIPYTVTLAGQLDVNVHTVSASSFMTYIDDTSLKFCPILYDMVSMASPPNRKNAFAWTCIIVSVRWSLSLLCYR